MTPFAARVLAAVKRIPPGRIATYGDVAAMAGRRGAGRAVGNIMQGCSDRSVPCHRVVAAAGAVGGYGGNVELKKSLLRAEGVTVVGNRIRGFAEVRWTGSAGASREGEPGSSPHPERARRLAASPQAREATRDS